MSSFSQLQQYQSKHIPLINQAIDDFFTQKIELFSKKDAQIAEMSTLLREFSLRGGKRIRPLLTILAYEYLSSLSSQEKSGNIYKAAAAVELNHLYLLNLDDMADRDTLRHGGATLEQHYKTTVFQAWKDAEHHARTLSMISGALLNSFEFELLMSSGFDPVRLTKATTAFSQYLLQDTVLGWQIHYLQNNQPLSDARIDLFLKGLEYVTSRYTFVGPLEIGLRLCGQSTHQEQLSKAFFEYGRNVGIAFQIHDDILGLFGDEKETGKAVGNDIREGKKTLLVQKAYQVARKQDQQFLERVVGALVSPQELVRVREIVEKTGSLLYSQRLAQAYVQAGKQALTSLPDSAHLLVLRELAEYVIDRKK